MKRSKLLPLISLVLSLLMLFSSCNKSENILKNVLDENAYPADPMPKYTTLAEAPHELSIARHDLTHGNLMLFKSGKYKQFIYNISNNTIVWSETQTQELTINVTLGNIYLEVDEISYFVVQ